MTSQNWYEEPFYSRDRQFNRPNTTPSLAKAAEAKIFEELANHISSESAKSVFAIGGTIPITSLDRRLICESDEARSDGHHSSDDAHDERGSTAKATIGQDAMKIDNIVNMDKPASHVHRMRCDPVTIRWDSDDNVGCKVTLPCSDDNRPNFEQLLRDCQPASFGRGGRDVMDESYRKAGKMDENAFCSNFNPYALGIIDTVAQALAPNLARQTNETNGLRAEPYKLNVYSSPSGKFKAHVDTPRSKHQVGSLVVCLPSIHQGGQLVLRHQGREQVFDWSGEKGRSTIQWAAFYSDCEHEVLEVTSGHRITLTYNLYATCWANAAFVDPEQIDLYQTLSRLLTEPGFCKDGIVLGYHCAHAYPHTEHETINALPTTLKGVDEVVYECFFATNFHVSLRHKLKVDEGQRYDWEENVLDDMLGLGRIQDRQYGVPQKGLRPPDYLAHAFEQVDNGECEDGEDDCLIWQRKADHQQCGLALLADKLVPLHSTDMVLEEVGDYQELIADWSSDARVECVKWLNDAAHPRPALYHGAYGNEVSLDVQYSHLVIIMVIPPFLVRQA